MIKLFAYLDAGTGSMILQAVIGAGIAILVVIKGFGHRIANFFRRRPHDKGSTSSTKDK